MTTIFFSDLRFRTFHTHTNRSSHLANECTTAKNWYIWRLRSLPGAMTPSSQKFM